ncbi:hypothetical protein Nm8I071_03970 [Nonomuraea sp. TT08I-71]|nr:hypothetical protein Nm8I071_03970 [Nonomuraea sp. TT08I-71]
MTEPAPPPGGDPTRPGTGPDAGGPPPASPWAGPDAAGSRPGPGSAGPEAGPTGYASPQSAPPGSWPPAGPYPPAPAAPPPHLGAPAPGSPHGPFAPGAPQGASGPAGWPASGAYPGQQPGHGGDWGSAPPASLPPPPREAPRPPKRVDAVPGTPFGVVHLDVPPVTSGLAIGSLVTGIASILVSLLVLCFGVAGPNYGGAWAAGAFTVLGAIAGTAAVVAGLLARRQIRRPAPPPAVRFTGRGLAVAGLSCGGVGLLVSLGGLALALVVQIT